MSSTARTPAPQAKRKPLMSRIPADFVQAVLKGHSALGIAFAAAIYLVCLTGTLSVFADEFLRWENASAPPAQHVSPEAVQTALTQAAARGEGEVEHIFIGMPAPDRPFMRVDVDDEAESSWIADSTGAIVMPLREAWTEFVLRLHIHLHLPPSWGVFIVGMTGVALLSSLISGLLAHPRIFRDAFHLRLGGSLRLQEADLHNRIGVWGLPFHLVVTLSGAFLGLATLIVGVLGMAMFDGDTGKIYQHFFPPEPEENAAPADLPDIVPLFERLPDGGRIERITLEHPFEEGAATIIDVRHDGALAEAETFAFKRDGELYYSKRLEDYSLGERVLGSLGPLHFGWFAGGIVKAAYGLLGLGLTYLAVGGVKIWLARRRDKGRPAPVWERVWAAIVWGQPVALAGAALAAIVLGLADDGALIPVWGTLTVLGLLAATVVPAAAIAKWGQTASGALLVLLAASHAARMAPGSGDGFAWIVDTILLAGGLLLLWLALRRGRLSSQP